MQSRVLIRFFREEVRTRCFRGEVLTGRFGEEVVGDILVELKSRGQ
jgi:hypothetical protein